MFEKLKYKTADIIEKIFLKISKSREKQRQKIIAKRNEYLERRKIERAQKERAENQKYVQMARDAKVQQLMTFNTIKQYQEIAGNHCSNLDKMSPHERDIVIKRVQKLCKEDETFRKDLEAWAKKNYELPKKNSQLSPSNKRISDVIEI